MTHGAESVSLVVLDWIQLDVFINDDPHILSVRNTVVVGGEVVAIDADLISIGLD